MLIIYMGDENELIPTNRSGQPNLVLPLQLTPPKEGAGMWVWFSGPVDGQGRAVRSRRLALLQHHWGRG